MTGSEQLTYLLFPKMAEHLPLVKKFGRMPAEQL